MTPVSLLLVMNAIIKQSSPSSKSRPSPRSTLSSPLSTRASLLSSSTPAQPTPLQVRSLHSSPSGKVELEFDPSASALDLPPDLVEPVETKPPIPPYRPYEQPPPRPRLPKVRKPEAVPRPLADEESIRYLLLDSLTSDDGAGFGLEATLVGLQLGAKDSGRIAKAFVKFAVEELSKKEDSSWERTWDIASLRLDFDAVSEDARGGSWRAATDICILHRLLEWAPQGLEERHRTAVDSQSKEDQPPTVASLTKLARLAAATDFRFPAFRYPASTARTLKRTIHLHVGPTNSGKTYNALKALVKAKRGLYAGPLRLLAHEVWERINRGAIAGMDGVGRACNLVTGEEVRLVDRAAGLSSLTVEMTALSEKQHDVAVFDEIQMIGDVDRGAAWTSCLLNCCAKEVHLCGEETVVDLISRIAEEIGDDLVVHRYQRLSPMSISSESLGGWSNIRPGDCVVRLSRNGIYEIKKSIEDATGLQCAVAYGGLPPELRAQQAALFNDPKSGVDVMVASDAVGMGLNL